MSLSKNNIDKLKSLLEIYKSSKKDNPNKNSNYQTSNTNTNEIKDEDPNDFFYSIIDNSDYLEETTFINKQLKKNEEKFFKSKNINSIHTTSLIKNTKLTPEDILYDEFNYLLDDI